MHRYIVISDKITDDDLADVFPDTYSFRENHVWGVASKLPTSMDVSKALKFNDDDSPRSGVVLKVGEYYGRYDKGLWQKLDAWKAD